MGFIETRGNDGVKPAKVSFSEAILSPSASFGGLYAPQKIPHFDHAFLRSHLSGDYTTLARSVLEAFEIDISPSIIEAALERYRTFDDPDKPVPLVKIGQDLFVAELYHGPTRAFKDMALQPFGSILSALAKARDKKYLILAATSGDTGPATLETFKNQSHVKVACLYPQGGTSDVQRLQMVTEAASNLKVIGVEGDFDDTQTALKQLLASKEFTQTLKQSDFSLSAANSVNFGRIIFQIIYHIHSYLELIRKEEITLGDSVYLVVPSGNFGNALGAYYAKKGGVPIEKILIASNENNILTDWIKTGVYDLNGRELVQTESPAMDILKSSNIERVLFDLFGPERTKVLMDSLEKTKRFSLEASELARLQTHFDASYSTDQECGEVIKRYAKKGYIMDTHTATCIKAYDTLREKSKATVIYSTAEWTKFSKAVAKALGENFTKDEEALEWVSSRYAVAIPSVILKLFQKPIVHNTVVKKDDIKKEILAFVK